MIYDIFVYLANRIMLLGMIRLRYLSSTSIYDSYPACIVASSATNHSLQLNDSTATVPCLSSPSLMKTLLILSTRDLYSVYVNESHSPLMEFLNIKALC